MAELSTPYIEIIEQPKPTALRFRYITESRKAGSILGENSSKTVQTFPAIKIHNYSGPLVAKMCCITEKGEHHPHKLVGSNCPDNHGVCIIRVNELLPDGIIRFSNVGIQCSKKDDIKAFLEEKRKILPDCPVPSNMNIIDLTCVRLMFKVYLGTQEYPLPSLMSRVIVDKKHCCDLTITRVSIKSASANGGEELFILCNRVKKEDIQVIFALDSWEGFGLFTSTDIFKECVVVCKVPQFQNPEILQPVDVKLFLRQPSIRESGDGITFTYKPIDHDPYRISEKRMRMANHVSSMSIRTMNTTSSLVPPPSSLSPFPTVNPMYASNQQGPSRAAATNQRRRGQQDLDQQARHCLLRQQQQQQQSQVQPQQVIAPNIFEQMHGKVPFMFSPQSNLQFTNYNPFCFIDQINSKNLTISPHVQETGASNIKLVVGRTNPNGVTTTQQGVIKSEEPITMELGDLSNSRLMASVLGHRGMSGLHSSFDVQANDNFGQGLNPSQPQMIGIIPDQLLWPTNQNLQSTADVILNPCPDPALPPPFMTEDTGFFSELLAQLEHISPEACFIPTADQQSEGLEDLTFPELEDQMDILSIDDTFSALINQQF